MKKVIIFFAKENFFGVILCKIGTSLGGWL